MIADFGLNKIINLNFAWSWYHERKVVRWQSIELLESRRTPGTMEIDPIKCDIYSYACLCLEASIIFRVCYQTPKLTKAMVTDIHREITLPLHRRRP